MSCKICKIPLAEGDQHFGCILHRNCSRLLPCSLDADEPPEYWDEVEAVLAAVACVSPERRSARVAAQSAKPKDGFDGCNSDPPPLGPIPISVDEKDGKLDGKSEKGEKDRVRRTSTSVSDSNTKITASRFELRKVSVSQPPGEGCEYGQQDVVPFTSSENAARQNPGSDISRKGKDKKSKKLPGKSTKSGEARKKSNPKIHEIPPEEGSDSPGRSEVNPKSVGNKETSARSEVSAMGTSGSSGATTTSDPQSSQVNELSKGPGTNLVNDPGRSMDFPITPTSQGRSSAININTSTSMDHSFNTSIGYGFQAQNPISTQPFQGGPPQWPPYQQQPWSGGPPPWYMPPYGPCNPWYPPPNPTSHPTSMFSGYDQPRFTSTEPIISTQPRVVSTVTSSISVTSSIRTLSVPSHRRASSTSTTASVMASVPSHRAKPSTSRVDTSRPPAMDDDGDDVTPAGVSVGDMVSMFSKDAGGTGDADDGSVVDSVVSEVDDDTIRARFSRERLFPILKAAGIAANIECEEEEEGERSLIFGGLGLNRRKIMPIVKMPPEIYTTQQDVRKYKGTLGGGRVFNTIFRVPEDDFEQLFNPPVFDTQAEEFFASQSKQKQATFLPAWEKQLVNLDRELRIVARLSAFQLIILNTLSIELSDVDVAG